MDGTGPQHPLTDSQLDRELESALGVEPSPEFLARVRTRVAAEPRTELWRLAIRRWTFEPLAGVAVVGIVLAVVVPRLMRDENASKPAPPVVATDVSQPGETQAPVLRTENPEPQARPSHRATRPLMAASEVPLRLSQPLFSDDDRRAFMQVVAAFEAGQLPAVVTAPSATVEQTETLPERRIAPLVIDPLPLLARVQKPGEGQW